MFINDLLHLKKIKNQKILSNFLNELIMKKTIITDVIGYVLLSPALVCVLLVFKTMLEGWSSFNSLFRVHNHEINLSLPFFIGVTAITGAYLIKDKK